MAFHQVREIMKSSCKQHEAVSRFYEELQELAGDNEKLIYVLGSMKEHEETIILCIKEYLKKNNSSILNSWYQYLPDMPLPEKSLILEEENLSESSARELFNEINSKFSKIYKKLADNSNSSSVNELFIRMIELTDHESEREGWRRVMLSDM